MTTLLSCFLLNVGNDIEMAIGDVRMRSNDHQVIAYFYTHYMGGSSFPWIDSAGVIKDVDKNIELIQSLGWYLSDLCGGPTRKVLRCDKNRSVLRVGPRKDEVFPATWEVIGGEVTKVYWPESVRFYAPDKEYKNKLINVLWSE